MENDYTTKDIFKKLVYGFGLTVVVSVLAGLFLLNIGFSFWITCLFFFILQVVGFYFYGESVKRKNAFIEAKLELAAASELAKISVDVVCPCDKGVKTTIPIETNSDNTYICAQCEKRVSVLLETKTFLKTDLIIEDPLKNPKLIKDVEEALKDPKHNDRI